MSNKIRTAYGEKSTEGITFDGPKYGKTKQSFKDQVNVNNIVAKYQRTGTIEHFTNQSPRYGDVSAIDFQEAMNTVAQTTQLFEALPSERRKEFDNDPAKFLEYVQNPDNADEMIEKGFTSSGYDKTPEGIERAARGEEVAPEAPESPPEAKKEAAPTE